MLIGNHSVLYRTPARLMGGLQGQDSTAFASNGRYRNAFTATDRSAKSGLPDGYRHPYAWVPPKTAGGLASRNIITGTGALTASGAMGVNGIAALTGTGSLTATGALIVSASATLSGSGTLTANLIAILDAAATLTGSGSLTATASALAWATAALTGTGSLTATRYAVGNMSASIQPYTELSPESLASSVWSAAASSNNTVGSMGEKLNDAGSGSNPWTEVIEGSYTAAELLRIMAAALAGELSGAGTTTVVITGVDGATDRITATVTTDGNRTAVVLDGD